METLTVPESPPNLQISGRYLRKELHDEFKGQRQYGISTPADRPFVLIFTDTETEKYGYSDRFLDNGIFVYSGEGQQGDMTMDGGNERILNHQENNDALYVFEKVDEINGADVFSFDGEYEYEDHFWEKAPDVNGNLRNAVRFKLSPVGGVETNISEKEVKSFSEEELFDRAKQSVSSDSGLKGTANRGRSSTGSYSRSQLVRDFALAVAKGTCQACEEEAPFETYSGEPFLEVHHIYRRSDGGIDNPENVIAICPNCHREVHHGKNGNRLNQELIRKANDRNSRFR